MKVKMKFDLASIKSWLLTHGEKVAFGIVAVVFLLFVYSALQRETLEDTYQPDKLEQLASNVGSHVQNSKWDAAREAVKVVNYAERAKTKVIPVGTYALPRAFNPPVTDPKQKRGKPEILPPEELRVAAGLDIFQVKVEKAGGAQPGGAQGNQQTALKAQPWAVVTGLVPIEKHRQAYVSAFAEAVEYERNRDQPNYLKPILERAEIDPAKPDQLTWAPVADVAPELAAQGNSRNDIIAAKYFHPELTAGLGTLAAGEWGEAVAHPKIPLAGETVEAKPAAPPAAPAGADAARPGEAAPAAPAATPTGSEVVPYALLRAFDYSVQPGKKYRYRITLALANPNSGVPPQFLQDPENAKGSSLTSAPTQPTSVVTIPDGHSVLAGTIDAGSRYTEPTAKILVTAIDGKTGLRAATEMDARRGTIANLPERTAKVHHPLDKAVVEVTTGYTSNILVLDIYGGNNLPGRKKDTPITEPGEILLLDANGNMTVRSEIDDHMQYEETIVRDEPPKPEKSDEDEDKNKDQNKKPKNEKREDRKTIGGNRNRN